MSEENLVEIIVQVDLKKLKRLMELFNMKDESAAIRRVIHQAVDMDELEEAIRKYRKKRNRKDENQTYGSLRSKLLNVANTTTEVLS